MDRLFPRRRILAGITTLALSAGAFAGAHANDATPLRIGVLSDMSSLYADIGGPGSLAAAKMAVEDFLAGPHKMKRQIEVMGGDHMNKADLGVNIAREWIDRNNVEAIIDVPNSSVALAVRKSCSRPTRLSWCQGLRRPTSPGNPARRIWSTGPTIPMRFRRGDAGGSGGGRQDLVHADRRLRVRTRDGG